VNKTGFVRRGESFKNLPGDVEPPVIRQPLPEPVAEGFAFNQLRYQVAGADVVESANIRMIQGRDGASLALDAVCEMLGGNLDRHIAVQAGVARLVHLTHAAGADQLQDFIRADPRSTGKRHLWILPRPLPHGRGSVSYCKDASGFLSRARGHRSAAFFNTLLMLR
jgi:hypothetical protein